MNEDLPTTVKVTPSPLKSAFSSKPPGKDGKLIESKVPVPVAWSIMMKVSPAWGV